MSFVTSVDPSFTTLEIFKTITKSQTYIREVSKYTIYNDIYSTYIHIGVSTYVFFGMHDVKVTEFTKSSQ